jgi:predicted RNA polymerase sigma factor
MSLEKEFESYQPFFAAKVDFYQRLGNFHISRKSYFKAIKLSGDEKEKEFLLKKLKAI